MTMRRMSTEQKKVVIDVISQNENIAKACREQSISRASFYRLKKLLETKGVEALERKVNPLAMLRRLSVETEKCVLEITVEFPELNYYSLADKIRTTGVSVSPTSIYKIWRRLGITHQDARSRYAELAKQGRAELWEIREENHEQSRKYRREKALQSTSSAEAGNQSENAISAAPEMNPDSGSRSK